MGFIQEFVKVAGQREELKVLCIDEDDAVKCAELYDTLQQSSDLLYENIKKQACDTQYEAVPNYIKVTNYFNKMARLITGSPLDSTLLLKIASATLVDDALSEDTAKYASVRNYGRDFILSMWYHGICND
jgi:hypothetical protein